MRAVVTREPGRLDFVDDAVAEEVRPGWIAVDIRHVGICGTDYHITEGKHPFLEYPRIMGHELSGVTASAGIDMAPGTPVIVNPYISCGSCIACRRGKPNCCTRIAVLGVHTDGGLRERIVVPEGNLYPAGDLSLRDAAMVEFLAIGAHAVRRAEAEPGARALVIGIGPIGLGAAIFAKIAGLDVTLLDTSVERLGFAREALGFERSVIAGPAAAGEIAHMTEGDGFDVVFDATGNARSIEAGFSFVAHGGSYVLVSVVRDEIRFSDPEFHKREMRLIASRNATRVDFEHVMAAIRAGQVPTDRLATHRATLEEAPERIKSWAHEKSGLIKAIIDL
ncbi:dehydrogenase [Aureimonas sp. Leaf454]|uniref:zinc-binding alcohol dehydrogenase family protein n=1 Tax=Aureimonas sp. Leaf454 TaxID=1736381 RepID=UPI0006F210AA|nr:zinc-binding alcohol dehydrogenase family protein [Aureimonas sp. Leaf454]KQT54094.1 dehydrogenase [Aureimonas sp. Leaf454]